MSDRPDATSPQPSARCSVTSVSRRALLGTGAAALLVGCSGTGPAASPRPIGQPSSSEAAATGSRPQVPRRSAAPPSAPPGGAPAREIGRARGLRPEVALTFHGAGDPALARQVLAVLASHHARATVLAVGTWLAGQAALGHAILAAGHDLGNHTWSHPTLADLARAAARTEIQRCRKVLVEVGGSPGRFFRPSGGQRSTALIRELAGAAGYPVCLSYDIDSLDWTDPGPAVIRHNTLAATAGSIVSLHLGHPGTVAAMPGILADLRDRGLRPVTATELLRP